MLRSEIGLTVDHKGAERIWETHVPTIGIAAIQLSLSSSNNIETVEAATRSATKRFPWIEMVVFGELAVNGTSLDRAEAAGGPTEQRLQSLARECGVWLIPGSLYEIRGKEVFNTCPIINPQGEIIDRYDKMFPFLPYEKDVSAGMRYVTFDVPGAGRFGIGICYDMWFPEAMRTLAAMGAEVILMPTYTNTIDRDVEISIARANAAVNQCYFVDVNVGGDGAFGRSVIFGPGGELIHESGAGQEVIALEVDFEQVRRARERGWHGLGQVLKSFRDAPAAYPFHTDAEQRRTAMSALGPLKMPEKQQGGEPLEHEQDPPKRPKLKIID